MAGFGDAIGGIFKGIGTAFGIMQNERDYAFAKDQFDYQKALNQQTMEREDTAIQRRVADLEAAGLNKNLAAGSAASASNMSTFGGRPNQRGIDFDFMSAVYQAQQQKLQTEYMREDNELQLEKTRQEINAIKSGIRRTDTETDGAYLDNMRGNLAYAIEQLADEWNKSNNGYARGFAADLSNKELAARATELGNVRRQQENDYHRFDKDIAEFNFDRASREETRDFLRYQWEQMATGSDGFNNFMRMLNAQLLSEEAGASVRGKVDKWFDFEKASAFAFELAKSFFGAGSLALPAPKR